MKKINLTVFETTRGYKYYGSIKINGVNHDYKLNLGVHIKHLNDQQNPEKNGVKKIDPKDLFQFSLSKGKNENEVKIEIDDLLFGFLVALIILPVVDYYNNEQINDLRINVIKTLNNGTLKGVKKFIGYKYSYLIRARQIPKVFQI